MAKVKDWIIDMESYTWAAIEANLSLKETIAYVKLHVKVIDEAYIRNLYEDYHR